MEIILPWLILGSAFPVSFFMFEFLNPMKVLPSGIFGLFYFGAIFGLFLLPIFLLLEIIYLVFFVKWSSISAKTRILNLTAILLGMFIDVAALTQSVNGNQATEELRTLHLYLLAIGLLVFIVLWVMKWRKART